VPAEIKDRPDGIIYRSGPGIAPVEGCHRDVICSPLVLCLFVEPKPLKAEVDFDCGQNLHRDAPFHPRHELPCCDSRLRRLIESEA
jgi:hypothetical protein